MITSYLRLHISSLKKNQKKFHFFSTGHLIEYLLFKISREISKFGRLLVFDDSNKLNRTPPYHSYCHSIAALDIQIWKESCGHLIRGNTMAFRTISQTTDNTASLLHVPGSDRYKNYLLRSGAVCVCVCLCVRLCVFVCMCICAVANLECHKCLHKDTYF